MSLFLSFFRVPLIFLEDGCDAALELLAPVLRCALICSAPLCMPLQSSIRKDSQRFRYSAAQPNTILSLSLQKEGKGGKKEKAKEWEKITTIIVGNAIVITANVDGPRLLQDRAERRQNETK